MASRRFVCFAARDRKRRFGGGPPPTTLSSSLSLLVYLSTSSLHLPPLFTPAASIAHSLRYVYRVLPAFLLVTCFYLNFLLIVSFLVVNHATYRLPTYLPTSTRTFTRATPWQLLQFPVTLRHPPRLLRISRNRQTQMVFLRLKPLPTVWTTWTTRSSRIFRGKRECCCDIRYCPSSKRVRFTFVVLT